MEGRRLRRGRYRQDDRGSDDRAPVRFLHALLGNGGLRRLVSIDCLGEVELVTAAEAEGAALRVGEVGVGRGGDLVVYDDRLAAKIADGLARFGCQGSIHTLSKPSPGFSL